MIFYYAVGGGLGHLTRARRVLETLELRDDVSIVTASPYARDPRVTGGVRIVEVPHHLEHDVEAHRRWMAELDADRLIVDAFPGGIQGELCGLAVPMDLVARLLRWSEYRRVVPGELPRFETTYVIEELTPELDAFVCTHSTHVVPLGLGGKWAGEPVASPGDPYWLIVHSGPEEEVRELIAYTAELQPSARVLVATQCDVPLEDGFERVDAYPASALYPNAERIITAAGFNVMLETEPWRDKHAVVPFPRRFDDQYLRASRRRT